MAGTVRVLLFASAREAIGTSTLSYPVPQNGMTVGRLVGCLAAEHPRLGRLLPACRLVINGEYAPTGGTPVRPGDELAIHPPYSGG